MHTPIQVPRVEENIRYVDVPQVIDRPREVIEHVPRIQTRVIERPVQVPGEVNNISVCACTHMEYAHTWSMRTHSNAHTFECTHPRRWLMFLVHIESKGIVLTTLTCTTGTCRWLWDGKHIAQLWTAQRQRSARFGGSSPSSTHMKSLSPRSSTLKSMITARDL